MYDSDGIDEVYEMPWDAVTKELVYIKLDCTLAAAHSMQLRSGWIITSGEGAPARRDRRLSPLSRPACFARCGTGAGGGVTE